jgi:hypothetical protein
VPIDVADVLLDKLCPRRLEFPGKERVTIAPVSQGIWMNSGQFSGETLI